MGSAKKKEWRNTANFIKFRWDLIKFNDDLKKPTVGDLRLMRGCCTLNKTELI